MTIIYLKVNNFKYKQQIYMKIDQLMFIVKCNQQFINRKLASLDLL